eukprot:10805292-Ditylum_brightwellii.AAC.1
MHACKLVHAAAEQKISFILIVTTTLSTVMVAAVVGNVGRITQGCCVVDMYMEALVSVLQLRITLW